MKYLFFTGYTMVFVAELIGDKAIYSICALALRYPLVPVAGGILAAFMGKMLAAVLAGRVIAGLPPTFTSVASALTFFVIAIVLWFRGPERESPAPKMLHAWPRVAWVSFAAIFFTEWGDPGQIAAAALAARYRAPLTIWLAATAAMATKAALAMTLGRGVQQRLPQTALRYAALCLFMAMGVLSLLRVVR